MKTPEFFCSLSALRLASAAMLTALSACGGGAGGSGDGGGAVQVATFMDAPVHGLHFSSASQQGYTDSSGNFVYRPGETVTFSVGHLVLGSTTPSGSKITPLNLLPAGTGTTDSRLVRMLQTLQSLDEDQNPENGIRISEETHAYLRQGSVLRVDDNAVDSVTVSARLPHGFTRSADEARSHFERHKDNEDHADAGYSPGTTPLTPAVIEQPVNPSGSGLNGRLLASNCYQCHGTLGRGGFDNIRGHEASEVVEYLSRTASSDIMAAHAQGYTRAQLNAIVQYLQQP